MTTETLPRHFGPYRLTAALGEDALGHEYRAVRASDGGFVRLRALDAPELSADAVLDAIEGNGEVHGFLKNAAVARGVDMDAADGVPYIAWDEVNGRTLKDLLRKSRNPPRKIPVEHALLISEKIATALDHAYNTTIDGDRTLHGLVWPGFVAISDDGEIRLAGFGLATGVLPALARPRLTREIAPYLAPEEREQQYIGKNSDVFSVGVMLLELLTAQPPAADPLAVLRGTAGNPPPPILPEIQAVLRMCLGPPESRYASAGDLRRELGKLLFSGPYSPSTFNLAYFLNALFKDEIEAEARARNRESSASLPADAPSAAPPRAPAPAAPAAPAPGPPPRESAPVPEPPRLAMSSRPSNRAPLWIALAVAAVVVAGAVLTLSHRTAIRSALGSPQPTAPPAPSPTFLPELLVTPAAPTNAMSDAQFQDEVSRRLALEVPKLEAQVRARAAVTRVPASPETAPTAFAQRPPAQAAAPAATPVPPAAEPTAAPTAAPVAVAERAPPTAAPAPTRAALAEGTLIAVEDADTPPRIAKILKPAYPPLALRARIGGIVVLRVLVSETGAPLQVEVIRGAAGGLTEAAVDAVRKWHFEPARKAGLAMRTWMVVPIPFEP